MKLILIIICLFLSGCADAVPLCEVSKIGCPVGFWHGLWHGIILPFAWLISLFSDSTAIYAVYNNGGWYDFGFVLGLGGFSFTWETRKK